jgi:hypothetical protein
MKPPLYQAASLQKFSKKSLKTLKNEENDEKLLNISGTKT